MKQIKIFIILVNLIAIFYVYSQTSDAIRQIIYGEYPTLDAFIIVGVFLFLFSSILAVILINPIKLKSVFVKIFSFLKLDRILTWLKDRNNLMFILLAILTLSVFKIAFYGIDTYSTVDGSTSTDITGEIDINNSQQNPIFIEHY